MVNCFGIKSEEELEVCRDEVQKSKTQEMKELLAETRRKF
jgi:hypothetical protein